MWILSRSIHIILTRSLSHRYPKNTSNTQINIYKAYRVVFVRLVLILCFFKKVLSQSLCFQNLIKLCREATSDATSSEPQTESAEADTEAKADTTKSTEVRLDDTVKRTRANTLLQLLTEDTS